MGGENMRFTSCIDYPITIQFWYMAQDEQPAGFSQKQELEDRLDYIKSEVFSTMGPEKLGEIVLQSRALGYENITYAMIATFEIRDPEKLRGILRSTQKCLLSDRRNTEDIDKQNELLEHSIFLLNLQNTNNEKELVEYAERIIGIYGDAKKECESVLQPIQDLLLEITPDECKGIVSSTTEEYMLITNRLAGIISFNSSIKYKVEDTATLGKSSGFVGTLGNMHKRIGVLFLDFEPARKENGYVPAIDVAKAQSFLAHEAFHAYTKPVLYGQFLIDGFNVFYGNDQGEIVANISQIPTRLIEESMAVEFQIRFGRKMNKPDNTNDLIPVYNEAHETVGVLIEAAGGFEKLMHMRLKSSNSEIMNLFYSMDQSVISRCWELNQKL